MASVLMRKILNRNLIKLDKVAGVFPFYQKSFLIKNHPLLKSQFNNSGANLYNARYCYSTDTDEKNKSNCAKKPPVEEKLTLFKKFKKMYKEYWYVLVPVHLVTSAGWFGGFYYLAKSGVDIPSLLQSMHVSESVINHLRDSKMGYIAVSYALYKIATPLRYTVTLGGTTISITYLKKWGYIKPVPSKERIIELYQEQKDSLIETMREKKEEIKIQSEKLIEKKDDMVEKFKNITEETKETLKKQSDKLKTKTEEEMEKIKRGSKN